MSNFVDRIRKAIPNENLRATVYDWGIMAVGFMIALGSAYLSKDFATAQLLFQADVARVTALVSLVPSLVAGFFAFDNSVKYAKEILSPKK